MRERVGVGVARKTITCTLACELPAPLVAMREKVFVSFGITAEVPLIETGMPSSVTLVAPVTLQLRVAVPPALTAGGLEVK